MRGCAPKVNGSNPWQLQVRSGEQEAFAGGEQTSKLCFIHVAGFGSVGVLERVRACQLQRPGGSWCTESNQEAVAGHPVPLRAVCCDLGCFCGVTGVLVGPRSRVYVLHYIVLCVA